MEVKFSKPNGLSYNLDTFKLISNLENFSFRLAYDTATNKQT